MRLSLLVPGLFGPAQDFDPGEHLQQRPAALECLLSRARTSRSPVTDLYSGLGTLFGLDETKINSLPAAALSWLSDTGKPAPGYILRADPVHLRPDQTSLRLFEGHTFSLSQEKADALVAAFNELYADTGWQLQAPCPQRWYLLLADKPVITTTSPVHVAGQSIDPALPRGADAGVWHAVLNEVQMLFHAHAVNSAREARGEPLINSVWFWGGGALPDSVDCSLDRVCSDHPVAMGLAQLGGIECRDVPGDVREILDMHGRSHLLFVFDEPEWASAYSDISGWLEALSRLEHNWFDPLMAALKRGLLSELEILPGNGRSYVINRRMLRAFWKPVRPLSRICANG